MRIGVATTTSEVPPAIGNQYDTASAFMIGFGDTGPAGSAVLCHSIADVTNMIGPRSATNRVLWDAADVYFREGGSTLYLSRVVGPTAAKASLTLQDSGAKPCVTFTANYPGSYGNALQITVTVSGSNYTVTITDALGNTEAHGPYATASGNAPLLASTSSYGTFTQATGTGNTTNAPVALTITPLTGGTDDRADATITQWQAALAAFPANLGPGQVLAPGQTNTTLSGIWAALGTHAASGVNRVAILNMDDGQTAATLVADLGSFATTNATIADRCAFWAGNVVVPGITPGTTRTLTPGAVIAALCARVDQAGNPNQPAAGDPNGYDLALRYVTAFTGVGGAPLYQQSDIDTLNAAGINTFNTIFGVRQNYGFVSCVSENTDTIAWQFNHARFRMALQALVQELGQPFVFTQLSQQDIAAFSSDLAAGLAPYVKNGAISTLAPDGSTDQGFVIDTGSTVNTPAQMAAGDLGANISYRPAPFAQLVTVNLNAIPTTSNL